MCEIYTNLVLYKWPFLFINILKRYKRLRKCAPLRLVESTTMDFFELQNQYLNEPDTSHAYVTEYFLLN